MKWLHITPDVKVMVFYRSTEKSGRSQHKPWLSNENPYKEISNEELLADLHRLTSC
jgi:hypothetical protein